MKAYLITLVKAGEWYEHLVCDIDTREFDMNKQSWARITGTSNSVIRHIEFPDEIGRGNNEIVFILF